MRNRGRKGLSAQRILVVEDEPNIVESLRFILERARFEVDIVSNGAAALERLRHGPFSALVLDLMLPGMDGLDVLQAVRRDRALAGLPVVVLTAKGQSNDRERAMACGASAYITKPFSNTEVVAQVRKLTGM
ncbi:response regulator [Chelativorans sp. AA-79]|uniref:response regulator transcription factor n=1 Tax=Chelativorans sp. AA-79 TaxID=3028735 RepID=UPI0023F9111E|nr:response regulator [Chelativorans sp. AA-79]WEX10645.1 response regulator [Chelativorans sp. AA-79]